MTTYDKGRDLKKKSKLVQITIAENVTLQLKEIGVLCYFDNQWQTERVGAETHKKNT